ncbi:MAG: TetR/AcrR family transcriptional regulator [Actinomycetota bacterium]
MARRSTTADRIAEAARRRFNARGYAVTTLTEIAAEVGISQGNLTYHYPTKRDLVTRIQQQVAEQIAERRVAHHAGEVEDDYVRHLSLTIGLMATYRFLLRDDAQIEPGLDHQRPHGVLVDGFAALRRLLDRVERADLVRRDIEVDLEVLSRALWMLTRYWVDHVSEMELLDELDADDQLRGVANHLAALLPNLTAAGRRRFEAALDRATPTAAVVGAPDDTP